MYDTHLELFMLLFFSTRAAVAPDDNFQSCCPHFIDLSLERFEVELQKLLQRVVFVRVQRIAQLRRGWRYIFEGAEGRWRAVEAKGILKDASWATILHETTAK